ncbi:MAG TPA: glucose-6-phosphate isomerase [Acetobacteraceae bacterium]|nr:glucose-6-phosphate isomerase [Acetobacteraceae bacterium]
MPSESPLSAAWTRLADLAARPDARNINALFAADADRARRFSASFEDLTLDFSKTALDGETLVALLELAHVADLDGFRTRLFNGEVVNPTEGRAAMHMALRSARDAGMRAALPGGVDEASHLAAAERDKMRDFVRRVHGGELRGATGETFDTVLNIGIGGSDLGPRMAVDALTLAGTAKMRARFLSNVDGHAFAALARKLNPARTLVLVASKTFTTLETMTNAHAVRDWMVAQLGDQAIGAQFGALSTNLKAVGEFGIRPEHVFGFRDWVGGRYSVWSPIGLPVALAAGWESFQAFLDGGRAMDAHFRAAPFAENLPVLLALVGLWHIDLLDLRTHCVLAYDERLRRFPAYLQQLEMESNGKSVTLDGTPVPRPTCPVVFGEPGTDAQHSFMQLVHQGTQHVPVDFIFAAKPHHDRPEAHRILIANALAQAEALLRGKTRAEAEAEMRAKGASDAEVAAIAPHRAFSGNRPSNTILFRELDGYTLGRLIALYEHKVAVQGWLWRIDSFDQWGVELGKVLAGGILPELAGEKTKRPHDGSTAALIHRFRALRGEV